MKIVLTLLILLTVFSLNTFAQDVPHTVLERNADSSYSIAFSPDGLTLASGNSISRRDGATVRLWDVATGTVKHTLGGHRYDVRSVVFSPDGATLASGSDDTTIRLWDVATGTVKYTLTGHTGDVNSVVFSPDGATLASESLDGTIRLWDVATGTVKYTLGGDWYDVRSVAFSPDGLTLASGNDDTVRLRDVATGTVKHTLRGHTGSVWSVAFSPDGLTLASRSSDDTIRLWDVATGTVKHTLRGHTGSVWSVAFSPDGLTLASGSSDDTIRLWDVATGTVKHTLRGHTGSVWSVAFSPDGLTLASGSSDDTIRLWDVETGTLHAFLTGHTASVYSVAFSSDEQTLASGGGESTVRLWKLTDTRVNITALPVQVPAIGDRLILNIDITDSENVTGYQARVLFDETALRYVGSANGDYLPDESFFVDLVIEGNEVLLGATSIAGDSSGDGTLVTLTFEFVAIKESTLTLSGTALINSVGEDLPFFFFNHEVFVGVPRLREDVNLDGVVDILDLTLVAASFGEPAKKQNPSYIPGDINKDGILDSADLALITILDEYFEYSSFQIRTILEIGNDDYVYDPADVNGDGIIDIVDLVLVAGALGNKAAAPSAYHPQALAMFSATDVQKWLSQAQQLNLTDLTSQRGILFLQQLLEALTPKKTSLLPNYPNPFNPETWIPYQLAKPADVTLTIYAVDGAVVRTLTLGHQLVGIYQDKSRAAYWDGKNALGESVASGVYFYTLKAGDFTATRKMLIRK